MNEVDIVFGLLDALQMLCCAVVGFVAICRIGALQWGVHRVEPIVAQFMLLLGASVTALGFMFGAPATWVSTLFALCVAVCSGVGLSRWRKGAPSDAQRQPAHSYGGST